LPQNAPTRVNRLAQPTSGGADSDKASTKAASKSAADNKNLNPSETANSSPNSLEKAATAPKVDDIGKSRSAAASGKQHAAASHGSTAVDPHATNSAETHIDSSIDRHAGSSVDARGTSANAHAANGKGAAAKNAAATSKNPAAKNKGATAAVDAPVLTPLTPKLAPLTPKMAPTQASTTPAAKPGTGGTTFGASPFDPPSTTHSAAASPATGSGASASASTPGATSGTPGVDEYPTIGKLETITFGAPQPNTAIDQRLSKLEVAVLKTSYPQDSLFDRTERLKKILIGTQVEETASDLLPPGLPPIMDSLPMLQPEIMGTPGGMLTETFEDIANQPENQTEISKEQAGQYALQLINEQRQRMALSPLEPDSTAVKIASDQTADLCERRSVSHTNSKGDNPDRRFTVAGGNGALSESLVSLSRTDLGSGKHTRAAVARMLKTIASRQDDREALLAPEASHLGVAMDWTPEHDKLIGCIEVVTRHGTTEPIPGEVKVGEHIDVRGQIEPPFVFDKVTVAWEAAHATGSTSDESEEALPYFPPLDYVAYQQKSEHDYSTAITVLKTAGIVAAIAGGVFMPPVAFAAPLIAMSGSMGSADPKPASDIPVHSGIHVDSSGVYSGKIPINNAGKEGTYYVTVWASLGKGSKSVPVSRRAILGSGTAEDVQGKLEKHKSNKALKHKSSEIQDNE
jgi:uncharacterized protein YkwD